MVIWRQFSNPFANPRTDKYYLFHHHVRGNKICLNQSKILLHLIKGRLFRLGCFTMTQKIQQDSSRSSTLLICHWLIKRVPFSWRILGLAKQGSTPLSQMRTCLLNINKRPAFSSVCLPVPLPQASGWVFARFLHATLSKPSWVKSPGLDSFGSLLLVPNGR